MALLIDNPKLEDRLRRLGKRQKPYALSATRMAETILEHHTRDIRKPEAWRGERGDGDCPEKSAA